jgi:Mg-chelatase subunit ChlD
VQPRTSDRAQIAAAIDALQADGATALYDAVVQGIAELGPATEGHRVLVVLSDGADNRSEQSRDAVIQKATNAGVPLFVIGLTSPEYDRASLQALAGGSGGLVLETAELDALTPLYLEVGSKIRESYRILVRVESWPGPTLDVALQIGGGNALRLTHTLHQ